MKCPKCARQFDVFAQSKGVFGEECLFCNVVVVRVTNPTQETLKKIHEIIDEESTRGVE